MKTRLRTRLLAWVGGSWGALLWANWRIRKYGVVATRDGKDLNLRKGQRTVRLQAKHLFFAPEVASSFEAFAGALPLSSDLVADYSVRPADLNLVRRCLANGATLEHLEQHIWLRKGNRAMILPSRLFVYAEDMSRNFEIYFTPLVPEERCGTSVLDFSQPGKLQTYAGSGLQFELASFPEEEDAIEEYFKWYRPGPGDIVFDVGAHCGVSTHRLSSMVGPGGRVVAFEPDPVNFALLRRNIERHSLSNVTPVQAAIASETGRLAFNSEGTIGSALVSLLHRESVGNTVSVEALRLADAFERWGIPAFCKIDIEGAEVSVLRDSREALQRYPVHLAIDTNHPRMDGTMTDGEVESLLRSYGYETASEARPLLTTWGRPRAD